MIDHGPMILVDTSVWLRNLAGHEPYVTQLDRLLDLDRVVGHELVHGELLIGDAGGRVKLLAEYNQMTQAATVPHADVVRLVRDHKLHGRGVGWIDVHLLTSAVSSGTQLWTVDTRLATLAREFRVGYKA